MKRIAILLLSALTLLTLLTGCIHEDFGIKLNADGTGSVSARIGIDKDVYSQALGMGTLCGRHGRGLRHVPPADQQKQLNKQNGRFA